MGFVPYILFLHALRRRRAAPLLVLELPNCSRSHYQDVIPSAPSFRAALETLLRREFGVTRSGEYVLLGHSLGTDYCSMVRGPLRPRISFSGDCISFSGDCISLSGDCISLSPRRGHSELPGDSSS